MEADGCSQDGSYAFGAPFFKHGESFVDSIFTQPVAKAALPQNNCTASTIQ
jgi:hypothetical protein